MLMKDGDTEQENEGKGVTPKCPKRGSNTLTEERDEDYSFSV